MNTPTTIDAPLAAAQNHASSRVGSSTAHPAAAIQHKLRQVVGCAAGLLTRLWLATLRVHVVQHPALARVSDRPWAYALWHGQIMLLLTHRFRRSTVALVSRSKDGEILASALGMLGMPTERGSSSRGGREGLRAVIGRLGRGFDAAFAADGPRGPRGVAKPGCLAAAREVAGVVVPFAAQAQRAWRLSRTWDRFEVPVPFSKVVVVLGPPILPAPCRSASDVLALEAAVDSACAVARQVAGRTALQRSRASTETM